MGTKVTTETQLPADATLTRDQFEIDDAGNVVVKNEALANALKTALPDAINDAATDAVSVGVVVDI